MAAISKLEIEVEIQSPADKFFDAYMVKAHIVPKTSSDHMHHVEAHEGDFVSTGSVKQWTYCLDGKVQTIKGKIEVDEEKKKVSSTTIEGEILNLFKSFKVTLEVIPKEAGSLVKWRWEYEKVDDQVPDPKKFLDLAINITKDVDAYILHHMAVATMETQVEIKSSADIFFKTYLTEAHLVSKTTSHNIHAVEVHEGDFHTSGSTKQWTYNLDGKVQKVKGMIMVDEENMKVTSTIIEGDALLQYKSFQITLQVLSMKDEEGSLVKWTWEYEKVSEDVPDPKKFRDLAVNITKDVDAHIAANA